MKKQLISMLVTLAMLLSSISVVTSFAAEPETYPENIFYDFTGYDKLNTWDTLQNQADYKAHWSSSGGYSADSAKAFIDERGAVYPMNYGNTNPKLAFGYNVTGGKYVISFDYHFKKESQRPLGILINDAEVGEKEALFISKDEVCSVINSNNWSHNKIFTAAEDTWYNYTIMLDMDKSEISYYIDGVYLDTQKMAFTSINQVKFSTNFSKQIDELTYLDNVFAGYAYNANLSFPAETISQSSGVSFSAEQPVKEASLADIKLLDASNNEIGIIAKASADKKTVTIFPEGNLTPGAVYTVDLNGLKSIFDAPYIQKSFSVQAGQVYEFYKYDFNDYYSDSHVWGGNIANWNDNWSVNNGSCTGRSYVDDGHKYTYKFSGNINILHKSDYTISDGKYVYAFDWRIPTTTSGNSDYVEFWLASEENEGEHKHRIARFTKDSMMFAKNSLTDWISTSSSTYVTPAMDKWYRVAFVIDSDNNAVTYYVDGEKIGALSATIPDFSRLKMQGIFNNSLTMLMDNFVAGYAADAGAYASNYLSTDGGIRVAVDVPYKPESLSEVVIKDNSGSVVEAKAYALEGNSEFYVVPATISKEKTYTIDISGIKSVAGESYKNKMFTASVAAVDVESNFDELSTGSWYVMPNGFSGTQSGHMGAKTIDDAHGRVYYTQNVDYVVANALKKTFENPITSGKLLFEAEYYSFEAGSNVKFDVIDSNDKTYSLVEFTKDNKVNTRGNNFTNGGITETTVDAGEYGQEAWQKVKAYIDLDKDSVVIYLNGLKIADLSARFDSIKTIKFSPDTIANSNDDNTGKHYALDNVVIKQTGMPVAAVSGNVTTSSGNLKITFNNPIATASYENASILTKDGTEVTLTNKELSANGKELTLSFAPGLVAGDGYTADLSGVYDVFGVEVPTVKFNVIVPPVTSYSDLSVTGTVMRKYFEYRNEKLYRLCYKRC